MTNQALPLIIQILKSIQTEEIAPVLELKTGSIRLKCDSEELAKINSDSLIIAGKIDLTKKIAPGNQDFKTNTSLLKRFNNFYKKISPLIIKLNHLGIGYYRKDAQKEVGRYKNLLKDTKFDLFEEEADDKKIKWLFVGKKGASDQPLFEISLSEYLPNFKNKWMPHFQIDLDTKLSYKQLVQTASQYLGNDFFEWKLDIPNYGVILCMGLLANVHDVKIWVGFGTNLRKSQKLNALRIDI